MLPLRQPFIARVASSPRPKAGGPLFEPPRACSFLKVLVILHGTVRCVACRCLGALLLISLPFALAFGCICVQFFELVFTGTRLGAFEYVRAHGMLLWCSSGPTLGASFLLDVFRTPRSLLVHLLIHATSLLHATYSLVHELSHLL